MALGREIVRALDTIRWVEKFRYDLRFNAETYKSNLAAATKTPDRILEELLGDASNALARINSLETIIADPDKRQSIKNGLSALNVEEPSEILDNLAECKKAVEFMQDTTLETIVSNSDKLLLSLAHHDGVWD